MSYNERTRKSHKTSRMFKSFTQIILTVSALSLTAQQFSLAKDVSAESIKNAVAQTDVVDKEYKQHIYTSSEKGIASVSLFRHPDATRQDCKIDTVLLARKIIALAPSEIKLVRCVFYDPEHQNQYWEIEVRAQLISAFAQGKIGEHELINSVLLSEDSQKNPLSAKYAALSYSGILNEDSVCKGSCQERRLAIHLRLKEIEQQGVELGHFREDFLRIEDAARRGKDTELSSQITSLNKALDEYVQEMVRAGQMQKPELHRAKKSLSSKNEPRLETLLGL